MRRDDLIRQKRICDRERRTLEQLFGVDIHLDRGGDAYRNEMLVNGFYDRVDGSPAVFGTWRPPAKRTVQRFGRARRPSPRPRYIPVLTPVLAIGIDLAHLIRRATCWTWRALDGGV